MLGALLLSANAPVSVASLIDLIWATAPPATARQQIQNCVSAIDRRLRRADLSVLRRVSGGYLIELAEADLDASRFLAEADLGRRALTANDPDRAAKALRRALRAWRGEVLGGAPLGPVEPLRVQLAERQIAATEDYFESELRAGRQGEVIAEIQGAVRAYPLRERLVGLLMRALHAAGRTAEALDVYRATRALLVDAYGLDAGPELHQVFLAILRQPTGSSGSAEATSWHGDDLRAELERALACAIWAKTALEQALDRLDRRSMADRAPRQWNAAA